MEEADRQEATWDLFLSRVFCQRLKVLIREQGGTCKALRSWSQLGPGSNSCLTTCSPAVCPWVLHPLTPLSLTLFICGMAVTIPTSQGIVRIAEIPVYKMLSVGLGVVVSAPQWSWHPTGRLLGGGGDTSEDLKDGKDFSWWKGQGSGPYL